MDTSQWPQEVGMVKAMEESNTKPMMLERKVRPQKDQAVNCPRCNSTNTKFCYYNNYSLTQPRYFCKTCRRYWTEGGSLRNIPVGGGSRKNKRSTPSSSSSTSTASSSHKLLPDLNPPSLSKFSSQNPNNIHQGQDLNLAFPSAMQDYLSISQLVDFPKIQTNNNNHQPNSSSSSSSTTSLSALELLRTGISSRAMNSFMTTPMPADSNALYNTSGFPNLQDLKPNLGFSVDGIGSRYGVDQESSVNNTGRLMFPFGVLKQASSTSSDQGDQNKGLQGNSSGYWNGMLGGGSW